MFGQWLVQTVSSNGNSDIDRGREVLARMRDERVQSKSHLPEVSELSALQAENDELKLYLAAVVRLLVQKRVCTVEEIRELATALDAADGTIDHKMRGSVL
jgi:hypothetical protein